MQTFSFLDQWGHYGRHTSRLGMLKLIGPGKDYWFRGFEPNETGEARRLVEPDTNNMDKIRKRQ